MSWDKWSKYVLHCIIRRNISYQRKWLKTYKRLTWSMKRYIKNAFRYLCYNNLPKIASVKISDQLAHTCMCVSMVQKC